MSLIELMVGLTVGLLAIAGALSLFASYGKSQAAALREAQLNRSMRLALDFITQDLKRAGYWENAVAGTPVTGTVAATNPHEGIASGSTFTYSYSRDLRGGRTASANSLDADEQFGFRLQSGAVQALQGNGAWQDLTDRQAATFTTLSLQPRVTTSDASGVCNVTCCASVGPGCPAVNAPAAGCPTVKSVAVDVALSARSPGDPNLVRSASTLVRVRNEILVGRCP